MRVLLSWLTHCAFITEDYLVGRIWSSKLADDTRNPVVHHGVNCKRSTQTSKSWSFCFPLFNLLSRCQVLALARISNLFRRVAPYSSEALSQKLRKAFNVVQEQCASEWLQHDRAICTFLQAGQNSRRSRISAAKVREQAAARLASAYFPITLLLSFSVFLSCFSTVADCPKSLRA